MNNGEEDEDEERDTKLLKEKVDPIVINHQELERYTHRKKLVSLLVHNADHMNTLQNDTRNEGFNTTFGVTY